jgi:hypothetical protein
MVPPLPDTPSVDTEFDLDVRLQAVGRHRSDDPVVVGSETCSCLSCSCQGPQTQCDCPPV